MDENDPESIEIQNHPSYGDLIDMIEKYGTLTKEQLVRMAHDESGEGQTLQELRTLTRGKLLADIIDSIYGGTCQ